MKIIKKTGNKQLALYLLFFVLFCLSYTTNIFRISEKDLFHGFERQPEGLVVGRLARSAQDGLFSYGALNGANYDSQTPDTRAQHAIDLGAQHDLYIKNAQLPDSYRAYKSQSAGQSFVFGILHKVLPCSNLKKLAIYRGINAILTAIVFLLFGAWVRRNFGFIAGFATLSLILLSPWVNMFAHNLWWVLWNFYIPFLTMLLLLEYKNRYPHKISKTKIMAALFSAMFVKCLFSGFEFITTTLISALCPVVYYAIKERQAIKTFLPDVVRYSLTLVASIIAQMVVLITQIRFLEGSFSAGVNHIIYSFTKRSKFGEEDVKMSFAELLKEYLSDDAFQLGFLQNNVQFYFGGVVLIILFSLILIYIRDKAKKALIYTTLFSFLAPLSWLIVFRQHAVNHIHMDYIIWYIPFLLYAFCSIGVAVSTFVNKKTSKLFVTK